MVGRKWLRRAAAVLTMLALFPGGIGGPVVAAAAAGFAVEAAAPMCAAAPEVLPAAGEEEGGRAIEEAIAARLAAERPGLGEEVRLRIAAAIAREAAPRGVDPWLVYAVIDVESGFDPHAHGAAGERGLMQILPSTARGVQRLLLPDEPELDPEALYAPEYNIRLGTAYLADLLGQYGGDEGRALTAYNTGRATGAPNPYARKVLARYARRAVAVAAGTM